MPDPPLGAFANLADIDPGEAAVLALAREQHAAVLMDDAMGREIAKAHGIAIIGACGILLRAKQLGLVPANEPVIRHWKTAIGYHLSDALVMEVRRRAGETMNQSKGEAPA